MRLADVLREERILVDAEGERARDKRDVLRVLASLLAPTVGGDEDELLRWFAERETLQSTGIGDGVAIPHTSSELATQQAGALLLFPRGIPFDSIDGKDCTIVFGVVGPKRAAGEHLRLLARISRLLRNPQTRSALVACTSSRAALRLITAQDGAEG